MYILFAPAGACLLAWFVLHFADVNPFSQSHPDILELANAHAARLRAQAQQDAWTAYQTALDAHRATAAIRTETR